MAEAVNGGRLTVTIFNEPGISLKQLSAKGLLVWYYSYYQALCDLGMRINLLSYSGRSELEYAPSSPDISVLCNSFGLPDRTYWRRVHQLHALPLLGTDIIRSRELQGIRAAWRSHWAWGTPIVCRMGFMWSTGLQTRPEVKPEQLQEAYDYERFVFENVTHCIPATSDLAERIIKRAPAAAVKTTVIPLQVDCDLFKPVAIEKRYDLVYVGWLYRIKNLEAILEAVERTGATIAIIGDSSVDADGKPEEPEVKERLLARFGDLDGRIHWLGKKQNSDLTAFVNQAKALILCSFSEGHPRAMLEALACGIPVIGSKVGGIQSTLRHGETGWLCDTDVDSIAAAIDAVLSQPRLIETMGANARKFALENFSLPAIARREYELLADVARRNPVESAPRRIAKYVMRRR